MNDVVTPQQLEKYFSITKEALDKAKAAEKREDMKAEAKDFLDMASRYYADAQHFKEKGEIVTAYAALNYAHGWLDAGARIQLFKVSDSKLFTVD